MANYRIICTTGSTICNVAENPPKLKNYKYLAEKMTAASTLYL